MQQPICFDRLSRIRPVGAAQMQHLLAGAEPLYEFNSLNKLHTQRPNAARIRSFSSAVTKSKSHSTSTYASPPHTTDNTSPGQLSVRSILIPYWTSTAGVTATATLAASPSQNRPWTFLKNHFSTINIERKAAPNPISRAVATPTFPNFCVNASISAIATNVVSPVVAALN